MGAVSGAMADAARRAGAQLCTRATVTAVETRADGVTVHWTDDDGTAHAVDAGHVVAGCAPAVLDELTGRRAGPRPEGAQLKVNMVLTRLPRPRDGPGPGRGLRRHLPRRRGRLADRRRLRAGRGRALPDTIPFEVYCHSLTDPSITGGTGLHTLTLFGLHTPAGFRRRPVGTREEAVRRVVAQLDAQLEEPLAGAWPPTPRAGRACRRRPPGRRGVAAMPGGHIFHGDLAWPVADEAHPAGTWGAATAHPRWCRRPRAGRCAAGGQRARRVRRARHLLG